MNEQQLLELGWKPVNQQQLEADEARNLTLARVAAHWGSQVLCLTVDGERVVPVALTRVCGDLTVGDWLLLDPHTQRAVRRLDRTSVIARKAPGGVVSTQLIAANIDTLFVVNSCNHDFNLSRIERYLAVASEADVQPIVVLTKADLCDDAATLRQKAAQLKSGLIVELLDARDSQQAIHCLGHWCRRGETVALVGSSGVGKSTLAMSLGAPPLETQEVREYDSKGRHTTTSRSIHRLHSGGLLIDTPGMRELQLTACDSGVADVFDDIMQLAQACHFNDCEHRAEPDCAVQAAIANGSLDPRRLKSYLKLLAEQAHNARSLHQSREESRKRGRFYKSVQANQRRRKRL